MRDRRRLIIFAVLMAVTQIAGVYLFLKDGNDALSRYALWAAFGISWIIGAILRTIVRLIGDPARAIWARHRLGAPHGSLMPEQ